MEIVSSSSNLSLHDHKKSTYLQEFLKHNFKTKQVIAYLNLSQGEGDRKLFTENYP